MKCPECRRDYERDPLIGVWTCFLHPSPEEHEYWESGRDITDALTQLGKNRRRIGEEFKP